MQVGDYLKYTVNIAASGPYTINIRAAANGAGGAWTAYIDNVPIGTLAVPNTGSSGVFTTVTSPSFNASLGNHIIKLQVSSAITASAFGPDLASFQGAQVGAVPAVAAVAGFNQLIINDDFQSATFANPATWLDCNDGGTPPASPLYYRAWVGFGQNIDAPCSAITQAADPLNGQLALHLHWQDSYFTGNNGHAHGIPVQTTDSAGNGRRTPMGFYIEFVARSATQTGSFPGIDVWSYTHTNTDSYEIDGAEEAGASNMSFAIHNNDLANGSCADPGSSPPCAGAVVNITQYHTYAWRETSAGSDIVFCAYVDGTLYGCNSISPVSAQLSSLQDMVHQMLIFVPGNYITAGRTKEMYIKSMKVWSCAGVNSGNHCLSASNNP